MKNFTPVQFDLNRAFLRPATHYQPALIETLLPLAEIVAEGVLTEDAALSVMTVGDQALAFVTLQLVYHHVVQGNLEGEAWLVSFCSICNSGAVFSPVVEDEVYRFSERGFYDAMVLLYDSETGSYWDHLKGQCVYGTLVGTQLKRLSNLLHMTAKQALSAYPTIQVALSSLSPEQAEEGKEDDDWRQEVQPEWSQRLQQTLGQEDTRLPRLDMGLGIWTEGMAGTSRYYPIRKLHEMENAVIDTFLGRLLVIYIDPETATPGAFFTDATSLKWIGDELRLSTGDAVRNATLFSKQGDLKKMERPLQLFSRWYGFAAKFPDCSIYPKR